MMCNNVTDEVVLERMERLERIVHSKWSMFILYLLSHNQTLRFSELRRSCSDITEATLTKELRMLEIYGMVHREIYREIPPRVEYSLTELGESFVPILRALGEWAKKYQRYPLPGKETATS